jgi:hypothetical protein
MSFEKETPPNDESKSEEFVRQILEEGNPQRLEELRKVNNLTEEQIQLFSQFSQLRRDTIRDMSEDLAKRKEKDQIVTEGELDLGTFMESIEPQVRDVVSELYRKGYCTIQSGFYKEESQFVQFKDGTPNKFNFSEELISELDERGVSIEINDNELILHFERFTSLDEIKNIWDRVVSEIPDLGQKAAANEETEGATSFREKYN